MKIIEGRQQGEYRTLSAEVKKVDEAERLLVLANGAVSLDNLHSLRRLGEEAETA